MSREKQLVHTNMDLNNNVIESTALSSVGPPALSMLVADSGATSHFVTIKAPIINRTRTTKPLAITTANGAVIYSSHTAELNLPNLPLTARICHVVPHLGDFSLISVGQLCDAGCDVTFTREKMEVRLEKTVIMQGRRARDTGLWHIDLNHHDGPPKRSAVLLENTRRSHQIIDRVQGSNPQKPICLTAMGSARPADLVAFHHAALFSPALSTLEAALHKGFLPPFPGLTLSALRRHPPQSVATIKGHLDQIRKNLRSTKKEIKPPIPSPVSDTGDLDDWFPASEPSNKRSHHCYVAIIKPERSGQIYSDLTGRFPIASSKGNNYLLIIYDYDSNGILAQPMRTRTGPCILEAYKVLHDRLVAAGLRPQLQRLDNEASQSLKQFMASEGIDYQLVPPGVHRRNAAERAIRTFKNHFIAGLCSTDKNFPLHLWDQLVPQAELTLNMLRGSRLNPKLSAHAQLNGHFDFNRTPIAPPGIRVLAHVKPAQRTTWSPHAEDGWYVGPAMESYRCYRIWLWDSRATRICDTIT